MTFHRITEMSCTQPVSGQKVFFLDHMWIRSPGHFFFTLWAAFVSVSRMILYLSSTTSSLLMVLNKCDNFFTAYHHMLYGCHTHLEIDAVLRLAKWAPRSRLCQRIFQNKMCITSQMFWIFSQNQHHCIQYPVCHQKNQISSVLHHYQ